DPVLAGSAPHDRGALPVEDAGSVLDGFAAAQLTGPGVEHERVPAELGHADAERDARASRRLVEGERDRPRAFERTAGEAVLLQGVGEVEDVDQLGGREVVVPEEGTDTVHPRAFSRAGSSAAGRAATKVAACSALRISGGASRSASGPTALTTNPASNNAA